VTKLKETRGEHGADVSRAAGDKDSSLFHESPRYLNQSAVAVAIEAGVHTGAVCQ